MTRTCGERTTVIGVFENRTQVDHAIDALRRAGFRDKQIGVVARNEEGEITHSGPNHGGTHAEEGAVAGALAGAGIGGLIGLGVVAGVIPIIGPAIAAGTLGTILLNAAGGAAIASVAGALIGMGLPEEEAEYYENELKGGRYLLTVDDADRQPEVWAILQREGAYNRHNRLAATHESVRIPVEADQVRSQGQSVNR